MQADLGRILVKKAANAFHRMEVTLGVAALHHGAWAVEMGWGE
jgi:hypothetical protein